MREEKKRFREMEKEGRPMLRKLKKGVLGLPLGFLVVAILAEVAQSGSLEPTATPAPTFKTLDEIPPTWSRTLPSNDGDPVSGCGSSRFDCVMGEAVVLDKETGIVWEQAPAVGVDDSASWLSSQVRCNNKTVGGRKGWRLPLIQELASLIDPASGRSTKLPSGHPFLGSLDSLFGGKFWAANTSVSGTGASAWLLHLGTGEVSTEPKDRERFYWCVRGDYGTDGQ